jgi:hypothetical protein
MAGGVLALSTGIDVVNPVSLDIRRGPWASLAAARAGVPLALRLGGLEVDILGLGTYQWTSADLSDNGLIPKSSVAGTTIWTVSGTNTYTATITGITAYAIGQEIRLKFNNAPTGASTLNINSIGAIPLQVNGAAITSTSFSANTNCIASYDGTNFQLIGLGGGGAGGDMLLAGTQTNTGLKTFLDGTLGMRNVANTFTSFVTNTNTASRTYTDPDFSGTRFLLNNGVNTSLVTNNMTGSTRILGDGRLLLGNINLNPSDPLQTVLNIGVPTITTTAPLRALNISGNPTIAFGNPGTPASMLNIQPSVTLNSSGLIYNTINIMGSISDQQGGTVTGIYYNPTVSNASNHYAAVFVTGKVGIGTSQPNSELTVFGSIQMVDGNESDGKALISNGNGVGAWTTLPPISTGTLSSGVVVSGASNSLDLGIGGSPLSTFTVNSSVSSNIQGPSVNLTGGALNLTGGASGVDIEVTGGGGMILKTQSTGNISLGTNNINRVTISGTNGKTIFGTGDNASLVVGNHTADHTSPDNGTIFYNSTLNKFRFYENGAWVGLGGGGGGSGDMVLANTQTNTGAKTFNDNTLLLRNVANTFSSRFTNTNTAAQVYTLPNATGTVSLINLAETFSAIKTFSAAPAFNVLPTGTAVANIATASTLVARDSSNRILAASLVDGFTTTATAGGTTTLVASSNKLQRFTGTLNQTVVLPTTTVVAGQQFYIVNASTGTITVNASGGTLVQNLAPNTTTNVTALIATPTLNTNWQSIYQPFLGVLALTTTGTSGAATLVGNTLNIPNYATGEVPLTFSTGLTRTANTVTVNTTQNITTLSNLSGTTGYVTSTLGVLGATGITLTGDVTGASSGIAAITTALATVNSNVGSFGTSTFIPSFTVNGKGLITAASATAIPTATTSVTGLLTSTDWNTFNGKQNAITLTTTGTSGAATLVGNTLNIPNYATGGAGWSLTGNSGLSATTNFIGTTDAISVCFRYNNQISGVINDINTSIGYQTLLTAQTFNGSNCAFGAFTLRNLTNGTANSAFGSSSLIDNSTGSANTAMGTFAGRFTTTGNNNTFIGWTSYAVNITGSNNTCIGANARGGVANLNNITAIGRDAVADVSNTFVLGDSNVVGWGFGVQPGAAAIRVGSTTSNGNGATLTLAGVWTNASDRTKKKNIQPINYGLETILKLNPVQYNWKSEDNLHDIGFIAQEVKNLVPEIVYGEEGEMTLSYGQITAILVKAIQQQQKQIEYLTTKLK